MTPGKITVQGACFGSVWQASGATNFFGQGWWYHWPLRPFGLSFKGATFVAKTTTLEPRVGNMPLRKNGCAPLEFIPKCIKVNLKAGAALNAVGLSGPGAEFLLNAGRWQKRAEPFQISFMSVKENPLERVRELINFVTLLKTHLRNFRARVGLQLNYSCPNTGHNMAEIGQEIEEGLEIASQLNIPLLPKVNALFPIELIIRIGKHEHCDAIAVSNTLPWGSLPDKIPWTKLFPTPWHKPEADEWVKTNSDKSAYLKWLKEQSPLKQFGGGGLSGAPLLPIVEEYVKALRQEGFRKPICAGGGILSYEDAFRLFRAGADAVSIGSIAMLRPWRVERVIWRIHRMQKFCNSGGSIQTLRV